MENQDPPLLPPFSFIYIMHIQSANTEYSLRRHAMEVWDLWMRSEHDGSLAHEGQNQSPSGMAANGGFRHSRWYIRGHVSHRRRSPTSPHFVHTSTFGSASTSYFSHWWRNTIYSCHGTCHAKEQELTRRLTSARWTRSTLTLMTVPFPTGNSGQWRFHTSQVVHPRTIITHEQFSWLRTFPTHF